MKSKLPISIAVICGLILLALFSNVSSNQGLEHITEEDAQDYAEAFLKTYIQQVESYFRPQYREHFDFYVNSPYNIDATVSSTHGAAIEFMPSNEQSFSFRTVEQPIELAVFPDVDLNITSLDINATVFTWGGEPSQAMFVINGTRNSFSGIIIITNKGHFLDLGVGGSVLLFDMNVDGRYYYAMMIKGSNKPSSWTKKIAKEDAIILFEGDLFRAFEESEEIREYMAYPILEELISQIVWKHQHAEEIGYDLLQYQEDLARVRDLAVNTYHLNSTFVDEILNWLEDIYPKRPWYEVAPNSWILAAIMGAIIGGLVTSCYRRVYKSAKRRWRSWRLRMHT